MENLDEPVTKKPKIKPKVIREWEEAEVFKLIALVEEHKCLWNAGDEAYHNKTMRDSAWRNIAEHFGEKYEMADLNSKWTNLRIQFRGYAGRARTKSGQGAIETPKWKYFTALNFVGRAEDQQTQKMVSNLVFQIDSDSNSIDHDVSPAKPSTNRQSSATHRRPQAGNNQQAAAQIADTMREAVTAITERNQNSSEPNATFANYLLSELNTLNNVAAAPVRKKVKVRRKTERINF